MVQPRPTSARGSADRPCILVVEDEPLVRWIAVEFLQDDGFRVMEAADAHEALALLQTKSSVVDLIFSDIQMPGGLNGCDLARWVRDNRPGLPVILTSGRVRDDVLVGDLEEFAPIELKPYRGERVARRMRAALGC